MVFAEKIRAENVTTIPELIRKRLGTRCADILALLTIFQVFSIVASQIRSLGHHPQYVHSLFEPAGRYGAYDRGPCWSIRSLRHGPQRPKTDRLNIALMVLSVMMILPIIALVKMDGVGSMVSTLKTNSPDMLKVAPP